jgi:UDPglucose--hexose-1-phosphate uridylyltransferase
MNGVGAHEVIIEHPDHQKQLAELTDQQVEKILQAYRDRSIDLTGDKRFKYVLIFKNHGFLAGSSLEHSHSQLIALPIVPKSVREELNGVEEYLRYRDRCVFCDIIGQEAKEGVRLLDENRHFISFCPFFSRFPFEIWILPKQHQADYRKIESEEIISFAKLLRTTLVRLRKRLQDPAYNFILHTLPLNDFGEDAYHWHLEIIPKLTEITGFEWGTGFYINPAPPEDVAHWLKEVTV